MEEPDFEIYNVLGIWESNLILLVLLLAVLLSAYLAASYLVGRRLRRSQVFVLTGLMLWFSFMIIAQLHAAMDIMIDMRELAFFGYTTIRNATVFKWFITVGCALAPLACIRFMIHMRHPRRADDLNIPRKARRESD